MGLVFFACGTNAFAVAACGGNYNTTLTPILINYVLCGGHQAQRYLLLVTTVQSFTQQIPEEHGLL